MRFIVRGEWQNKLVEVTWDDGKLEGPEEIVSLLHVHAELRRDKLGPPLDSPGDGANFDGAGLSNPVAALLLIQQLFDRVDSIEEGAGGQRLEQRARNMMRSWGSEAV
jgi:hypothetical protein